MVDDRLWLGSFVSGLASGCIQTMVMHPFEYLKVRFQVSRDSLALRERVEGIFRERGLQGLWRGVIPSLVANTISWGVYFCLYDTLRREACLHSSSTSMVTLVSSLSASLLGVLVTNPLWVIRTRVLANPANPSMMQATRSLIREGFPAFYIGLGPSLALTSTTCLQFVFYEQLKAHHRPSVVPAQILRLLLLLLPRTPLETLLQASLAKLSSSYITYPLQVARSRLQQCAGSDYYKNLATCVRRSIAEEGLRSLYKGLVPHTLRSVPAYGLLIACYESIHGLVPGR